MATPIVRYQTPMLRAADLARTVAFYQKLGFELRNSVTGDDGRLDWVWLRSDHASLMFALAREPFEPQAQVALIYLYTDDVEAMHAHLEAQGVVVGPISKPFYAPRGEFGIPDPDGWCVVMSHT